MASQKKRSRKRRKARRPAAPAPAGDPASDAESSARPSPTKVRAKAVDERPPAPWGNFPLVQISVLAGLALIILGALDKNAVQLVIGLGLGSLGGFELAIREHFAGYRSHTTLMAGMVYVIVLGLTFFVAKLVLWQCLIIAVILAGLSFWQLREKFKRTTGGLSYKLK
jgi:hypothetical protein